MRIFKSESAGSGIKHRAYAGLCTSGFMQVGRIYLSREVSPNCHEEGEVSDYPEQREFEWFEHTGEYRVPKRLEFYQPSDISGSTAPFQQGTRKQLPKRTYYKRWILRKKGGRERQ